MIFLRRRFGAATLNPRKVVEVLYPPRRDSQVTRLGTYKTNHGKKRPVR